MACECEPCLTRALSRALSRACVAAVSDVEKTRRAAATSQEPPAAEPPHGASAHGSAPRAASCGAAALAERLPPPPHPPRAVRPCRARPCDARAAPARPRKRTHLHNARAPHTCRHPIPPRAGAEVEEAQEEEQVVEPPDEMFADFHFDRDEDDPDPDPNPGVLPTHVHASGKHTFPIASLAPPRATHAPPARRTPPIPCVTRAEPCARGGNSKRPLRPLLSTGADASPSKSTRSWGPV